MIYIRGEVLLQLVACTGCSAQPSGRSRLEYNHQTPTAHPVSSRKRTAGDLTNLYEPSNLNRQVIRFAWYGSSEIHRQAGGTTVWRISYIDHCVPRAPVIFHASMRASECLERTVTLPVGSRSLMRAVIRAFSSSHWWRAGFFCDHHRATSAQLCGGILRHPQHTRQKLPLDQQVRDARAGIER